MNGLQPRLEHLLQQTAAMNLWRWSGRITRVNGLLLESSGPPASVGDLCRIQTGTGQEIPAEVVGFREETLLLFALERFQGVEPGCPVVSQTREGRVPAGYGLLGRVIDGLGRPLDGKGPLLAEASTPLEAQAPNAMTRPLIEECLETGVRAIDSFVALGKGQRLGIFAGSGVGKSTLLGMLIRHGGEGVNVVALVGERGRELREFIERDLGPEGMKRSVVVVSTSDQAAPLRLRAARLAVALSEYFRDQAEDVRLYMDSLTRLAYAQREIGLASGEPPTTRGYTPSVFTLLPQILERAGTSEKGAITGIYTVLVDGGDMDEPVADAVRGILDGHMILSRELATSGQYPPIDVLESVSRLDRVVCTEEEMDLVRQARSLLSLYRDHEDLIVIGAYKGGSNPQLDRAIRFHRQIREYLSQRPEESSDRTENYVKIKELLG